MALFEKQLSGGSNRSNTKLIVSGGTSPAEKWVADPALPVQFSYPYAVRAEQEVVIPKGLMVAVGNHTKDTETGAMVNSMVIADGTAIDNKKFAVGMVPYNISKKYPDFLYGNQPAIITREYVELPLFTGGSAGYNASLIKYGAVYGSEIKAGDYLKVAGGTHTVAGVTTTNAGQLTKWVAGTDGAHLIVGQVLATDENQEPFGWLKWAQYPEELVDLIVKGATKDPYNPPGDNGFPYDPEYVKGLLGPQGYDGFQSFYTTNPTGLPGILDGSQKAETVHSKTYTAVGGAVATVSLGLKNIVDGTVTVNVDGGQLTENTSLTLSSVADLGEDQFFVDYTNGNVYYKVNSSKNGDALTVGFRAHFYGTPTGWDYKGSVGVARVLLKL